MTELLPPFLQPLSPLDTSPLPCQNAQFVHRRLLGSSHALWWSLTDNSAPDQILLFIPGNPGILDFYIPFLSAVHATHSEHLAILAHGHLDHTPEIANSSGRYRPEESLTIQVETSLEVLDALVFHYPGTPIVVVAHSVGTWITAQLLKARPNQIKSALLLTPTLSNIANTPHGRILTPLFAPTPRKILSSLSVLLRYIPDFIFSRLLRGWPDHQVLVARKFLASRSCIDAVLAMAHEEMQTIRDLDTTLIEANKHKLWFYYAEHDDWVGTEKHSFLSAFDPQKTSSQIWHGPSEVPHAFCINHGELLAKHCNEWLAAVDLGIPSDRVLAS